MKLDTSHWQEFEIEQLFEIRSPQKRKMNEYQFGDVPYVSSGSVNNGIVSYMAPMDGETLERGGCITVSPLDGSSFYQEADFLGRGGAGSAISMLYNKHMTKYSALFICTVIKQAALHFDYADAFTSKNLRKTRIKLPATASGGPDWQSMEDYMKQVARKAAARLDALEQILRE